MATFHWQELLTQWSQELMAANNLNNIPPGVIASGWLGYPGATEDQIVRTETRLGTKLPPSYREFLQVAGGWRQLDNFIYHLWSVREIEWFAVRHQDWIDAFTQSWREAGIEPPSDKEYLVYGEQQDSVNMRVEYLQTALEISDVGDSAVLLLNPQVVTDAGEWEAWFFANWSPGATRYPSFWQLMQSAYQSFLDSQGNNDDTGREFT